VREEDEVAGEHARDGARRPHHRDEHVARRGRREGLGERRGDPGEHVEEEEARAPERVLDVVPEDPQRQHVEPEVKEPPVQEHRGQDRERWRDHVPPLDVLEGEDLVRDRAAAEHRALEPDVELPQEEEDVRRDERVRQQRGPLGGGVVLERDHGSCFLRPGCMV
jgi:hypothetical protein